MSNSPKLPLATLVAAVLLTHGTAAAQERDGGRDDGRGERVLKVIAIGDHPYVDGLRINFRDANLRRVNGINLTMWTPYDESFGGQVTGLALGLPMTGAGDVTGLSVAPFGVGASGTLLGATITGLGAGAGESIEGLSVGGLGLGAGGDVRGLAVGGLGVGAGGDLRGTIVGGLGVGAGGNVRGIIVGGIGAAAGGNVRGLMVGGVGVGAGGNVRGISIGGVGVGAGGRVSGLSIGGVGVGSGGGLHGLSVAGLGLGSTHISGMAIAPMMGMESARAVLIAALVRTERNADVEAISIGAVNAIRGDHRGMAIGIVNYAETMRGVQIGVLNIIRDNPAGRRVLPVINWD